MYKNEFILIIIQFFLFFPLCFANQIKIRKIISSNIITITIKGNGNQKILSDKSCEKDEINYTFDELPNEILVNGVSQSTIDKYAYNLIKETNNITMKWNSNIISCSCMFYDLSNIISIDFSQFNTSQVTNMLYMFNGCTSLVSLDLTNFNTELVKDMHKMFFGCSNLREVKNNFKAPLVVDISNMFDLCQNLVSIDLSNFEATSALWMAYMFCNCNSLITVNLSNFNAEKSLYIDNMFNGCSSLKTIDFTNYKTSTVLGMGNLFYGCKSLEYLDLSSFDVSLVDNMGHMFYECNSLTSIIFKNFNTKNVKSMDYMFCNCTLLKSLDLSSFDTKSVNDMSYMFDGCYSLKFLELGIFETNLVTNMEHMFYNCSSLISLNLKSFNILNVGNFNNMFDNCKNTLQYCINEEINSPDFTSQLSSYNKTNCSILCSLNSNKYILEKNICIKSCLNDDDYQYEYNDICYFTCPNGTFNYNNDNLCKSLCENYYDYEQASCVDEIPMGYYINNTKLKTIDKCNIKCYNCTFESMSNDLCALCSINQSFYPKMNDSSNKGDFINCYNETPIGYYLDSKDLIYKLFSENTYKLEYTDINSVKSNSLDIFHENLDNSETINNLDENNNIISDNINKNNISNNSKLIYYFYDLNSKTSNYSYETNADISELKKIYTNLTFIELSLETKNLIIKSYNLDEKNDKIYLVINDYPSNDPQMAIYNYDYKLILENGTEIDLSKINIDFYADLSIPIINEVISNFNYYKLFYEQGYDIYEKNDDFYSDICSPAYLYDNDITIEDRKNEIYPNNVTLCKENCQYKSVDIENKKINCYCNLNINKNYTQNYEDNNFIIEEDGDFFDYLLDNINYKIFKCYNLVFNIDNLIINISFYFMVLYQSTIIIINIKFYFCDLSKIKILSVKNSIIDKIILINKPREKHIINMKSKKNILEPSKKKNKFKKKGIKIKQNKTDTKKKYIKDISHFSQINSGSNILLNNDKNTKDYSKKKFSELNINSENQEDKEDFNELPFILAKNKDKRNIFEIFVSIIVKKLALINLFCGDEKIKILLLNEYILSLLVDFFFNALLYSDEVVSHKYHNNGKLDFIVSLILSLLSNIISSIFCYFLNYSEIIEERLDQILQMKRAYNYPFTLYKFLKNLELKVFLHIFKELFIILFCFYYLIIFTIVYSYSKLSLLYNYLFSLIEKILESLIVSIIIAITRKISLQFSNRYIYNTSKYINDKF